MKQTLSIAASHIAAHISFGFATVAVVHCLFLPGLYLIVVSLSK
jgi:hypothetical protein